MYIHRISKGDYIEQVYVMCVQQVVEMGSKQEKSVSFHSIGLCYQLTLLLQQTVDKTRLEKP